MFAARLITVIVLVAAILIAYNPQFRELVLHTWETIGPVAVEFVDGFYATVRSIILGDNSIDQIEHPPNPGGNFDRIVT